MKIGDLKKKVAVEGGIIAAVLAVLLAIYAAVASYFSSLESEYNGKQNNVNQLKQSMLKIEQDVTKASASQNLFVKLSASSFKSESLSRDAVKEVLDRLQKKFDLSSLKVKIKPLEETKNKDFKKQTVELVYSQVDLEFSAMSDGDILGFVDSLRSDMPGMVHIKKLTLSRKEDISQQTLSQISGGEVPGLVSGTLVFYWAGFKEVSKDVAKEGVGQKP